jgi:hypothetical protein
MKAIQEIMNRIPDKPIYHYTSQSGLLGIFQTKSIWATCIHYLNDSEEFLYAINLAKNQIRRKYATHTSEQEQYLLREMEQLLLTYERVNVFVSSFSEEGDLLSQWRGYGSHSSGFSLAFNYEKLRPLLIAQGFILAPCIYDLKTQSNIIEELIESTLSSYGQLMEREPCEKAYNINRVCQSFISRLVVEAAMIKHPNFSEEREWRMLSGPLEIHHPQVSFREGVSMVTPYFNFKLENEENRFSLFEVVVGPTPHKELAQRSVSMLVQAENLDKVKIRSSTVPFRGW